MNDSTDSNTEPTTEPTTDTSNETTEPLVRYQPYEPSVSVIELLDNDDDWSALGSCSQVDPEIFFPEKGGSNRDAKLICTKCDVREQCLQYALDNDENYGIWGGLSKKERQALKHQRTA